MKVIGIILSLCCGIVFNLAANEITATVVTIVDGNTIEIESQENGRQKIVLLGVDSPELDQDFGREARQFLQKMLLKKSVKVEFKGKDRRGNHLAIVMIDDDDIRVSLLKQGLAWTAEKDPDADLEPYRVWAERKGKGLWSDSDPTPPWIYRRQQSMTQPKSS